jgi:PST family polysaccharide transporter
MLEILVLGFVSGTYEVGLFGLAFSIAGQANTVIAYQLGVVLQPIFGRLQDDPERQVAGFLKAQRVLSAVCVPICFTQAILAEPLFRLVLDAKWQPAIPVFQVVSLMQAFYFATGPSMSCLRAQRRFGTFFAWQGIQLVISLPIYWMGADWKGALGIAIASGLCWAISAPLVVWLCTLASPRKHLFDALAIFVRPWVVCVPLFGGFYMLTQWSSSFGRLGDIASLFVVGPIATLLAIWIMRFLHADIRNTIDGFVVGALKKIRRSPT